jgi:type VI secretion system secreted protein Hcp
VAVDYFLELANIEGESKSKLHKNEIDVISWHWGATSQQASPGGGRQRKVEEFTFVHRLDKASPLLLNAFAQNTDLGFATLTVELAGSPPLDYARYEMNHPFVSAIHPSAEGSQSPVEEVSLAFTELTVTYHQRKSDGTLGPPWVGSISWIGEV